MIFNTVIDAITLAELLAASGVVVIDCRFYLGNEDAGRQAYELGHIPTAQYVHLNEDLSDLSIRGNGRHPLPSEESMSLLFGRLGISAGKQVVVYDDTNGAAAARLWWMLRYMGHEKVAVLDGGLPAWIAAGFSLVPGVEENTPLDFVGHVRADLLVQMSDVGSEGVLIDSRLPERYRGEMEPIDPVAGHIPGARNHSYHKNYDSDGRLLAPSDLRQQFEQVLGGVPAEETTFYCGSGVTACNNLLALAYSDLGDGRLYVGSWSQWCGEPQNPIAAGE